MTNQNQYSPRFIPNNQKGNYYAFRRDLTQAQQNNPLNKTLNFQPSTSNNINRQGPVKRQYESQRDQSRMDVNFHQAREENDREGHTSPYVNIIHHNKNYKGMIDTGSSINIIRENFEHLEQKEENLTVYTI